MSKRKYVYYGVFCGPTHTFIQYKRLMSYRKAYKKARFKKAIQRQIYKEFNIGEE